MPKGNLNPKREIVAKGNLKAKTGNLPKREFKPAIRDLNAFKYLLLKYQNVTEYLPGYFIISPKQSKLTFSSP